MLQNIVEKNMCWNCQIPCGLVVKALDYYAADCWFNSHPRNAVFLVLFALLKLRKKTKKFFQKDQALAEVGIEPSTSCIVVQHSNH